MRRGRRVALFLASAVGLLLIIATLWHFVVEGKSDPRAYPGSQSQSLDRMFDYYHIDLPECTQSTLRFARFSQFTSDSFYLYFRGEDHCLSEFLASNGLDDEERYRQQGLPFRPGDGAEFGWPEDEREYTAIDGTLTSPSGSSLVAVEIVIDYSTSPRSLYLWAGIV